MVLLFPIRLGKGNFTHGPQIYSFKYRELDEQDKASYATLCKYVNEFCPAQWVTRAGAEIVDEDGELMREARAINTKVFLVFKTSEEPKALLGILKYSLSRARYLFMLILIYFFLADSMSTTDKS